MANSKLLLIHDVEELGRSGDIVSVKPGFARNFLLPKKFAVIADQRALRMQTRLQEERLKKAEDDKKQAEQLAAGMEGLSVTTIVKVDHDGHMYGSVSVGDIVDLIQEQASLTIEKRSIHLKHPLKKVGEFEVAIKLQEGVTTKVTVKIIPEDAQS